MTFLEEIKKEICESLPKGSCCRRGMLLGMLAARGKTEEDKHVLLPLADASAVALAQRLIKEQFGRIAAILPKAHGGRLSVLSFESAGAFRYLEEPTTAPLTKQCPHCATYFLRGVFLAAGRITDPAKAYHLEISLDERARTLLAFLEREYMVPLKYIERRNERILYLKDSSLVEEFMTMLGINDAAFCFMNSKIEKQFRNEANRRTNCEAGNIARSVYAAQKTVRVLERLHADKLLSSLPEELESVARMRLAYPEASLTQLAAMTTPPLTKSGVNHRLQKVMDYAKKMGIDTETVE